MIPTIGFAGMTHLGINSAVATAEKGFEVVCFDQDKGLIARLNQQELPIIEPELPELLSKNSAKLSFTTALSDLKGCSVVYIALDVPTDSQGKSDLSGIQQLIEAVSSHLNEQAVLVILCQVPPGFTRSLSFPLNRLYYQVETLVFGRAIERALYPERFIIGCHQPKQKLPTPYQRLLEAFGCPLLPMRYESAELAKISINFCLVASISVANTLSEICEKTGADWSEIAPALKLDKRIGPYSYLTPGLGIAGGNLERDLTTILEISERYGTDTGIVAAWLKNSKHRRDWVLRVLHAELLNIKPDSKLAVLGLAYKENTHSIKNSPALALLAYLTDYAVTVYDPVVGEIEFPTALRALSATSAATGADALIIMTPWDEFRKLSPESLRGVMNGRLIIDPYRVLDGEKMEESGFIYLTLGVKELC